MVWERMGKRAVVAIFALLAISLADDEEFQVRTPVGVFRMSKAQFYRTFANVARSMSYRERGLYHYPTVPGKADQFRVG